MRLLLIGTEYAGKTTLAEGFSRWMIAAMDLPFVRWHNHFVAPELDRHLVVWADEEDTGSRPGKQLDEEFGEHELDEVMALSPSLLEQFQRHMVWRHLHPDTFRDDADALFIQGHYADAVYAPIYYGYGEPESFSDRRQRAREWDRELLEAAPDTVLVLVKASAEVIRQRMSKAPRPRGILQGDDVELVLRRFDEEYSDSLIQRRIVIDTTDLTPERAVASLGTGLGPFLSQHDLMRMAAASKTPRDGGTGR